MIPKSRNQVGFDKIEPDFDITAPELLWARGLLTTKTEGRCKKKGTLKKSTQIIIDLSCSTTKRLFEGVEISGIVYISVCETVGCFFVMWFLLHTCVLLFQGSITCKLRMYRGCHFLVASALRLTRMHQFLSRLIMSILTRFRIALT